MNKGCLIAGAVAAVGALFLLVLGIWFVSIMNHEAQLRNHIAAKQKDNTSQYDNTWKILQQSAQVPEAYKDGLMDVVTGYAKARGGSQGSLATSLREVVPNLNDKTYENLQNIVVAQRNSWTQRQTELIDLGRAHDNLLATFPSSLVCSLLGRTHIDITIVTSTRTDGAFRSGKDDDIDLFKKAPAK